MDGMVVMSKFKARNTAKEDLGLKKSKSQLQVPLQFRSNRDNIYQHLIDLAKLFITCAIVQIYFPFSQNEKKIQHLDPCDERNMNMDMDMDMDDDWTQKVSKVTAEQLTFQKVPKRSKIPKRFCL